MYIYSSLHAKTQCFICIILDDQIFDHDSTSGDLCFNNGFRAILRADVFLVKLFLKIGVR